MGFASLGPNYRPLRGACVWKHLGTRWNDFSTILQQGAGEGGGGPPANEDTPPPPGANVPAFPLFRWIAGAKLGTLSIYFPGTTTTGLFLRWRAILGPCYIYFKWGLLHIDALPRTTPDNHVELSSVYGECLVETPEWMLILDMIKLSMSMVCCVFLIFDFVFVGMRLIHSLGRLILLGGWFGLHFLKLTPIYI